MEADKPETDTSVGDEAGLTLEERDVRGMRSCYGCYFILWGTTVLPYFLLGLGFSAGFADAMRSWISNAAHGNPLEIVTLVATLPLLTIPWWLWAEGRRPR